MNGVSQKSSDKFKKQSEGLQLSETFEKLGLIKTSGPNSNSGKTKTLGTENQKKQKEDEDNQ